MDVGEDSQSERANKWQIKTDRWMDSLLCDGQTDKQMIGSDIIHSLQ